MEKLNIAELLKDCPKGMELDCTMFENVTFVGVNCSRQFPIEIAVGGIRSKYLTKEGCFHDITLLPESKCVIFPKGKTTWEEFHRPFKDGDIVISGHGDIHLLRTEDSSYCAYRHMRKTKLDSTVTTNITVVRLATEEEKAKLFQAIKDNGYKWNSEAKTLEKLIEPKFKVGDRIGLKCEDLYWDIKAIEGDWYICNDGAKIHIGKQHHYELASSKFNVDSLIPFESKVLVRTENSDVWEGDIFVRYDKNATVNKFHCIGGWYEKCIPYNNKNSYLLGTTNNCNDYYKTWEN